MNEEIMEQIPDYISLTDDLLFHLVFTKNDRARVSLISSLLGIPESEIISAEVVNPIQLNESFDTKITVLDLNVHLNNDKHVLVEMQVRKFASWTNRTLIYACREIDDQTKGKEFNYDKLEPVIQIAIMDYTLFPENRKFFARYKVQDEETGYLFTDRLQFYVMDLTAIDLATKKDGEDGLVDWANAFNANDWKTVERINHTGVKEARKTMEAIMSSPEQRRIIWDRRKALLDERTLLAEAKAEGIAEGKAEGENKLGKLMSKLFALGRIEDAKRCSEDEKYREKLYTEFNMNEA